MGKWLGAVAVAAVLATGGGAGVRPAAAADTPGGSGVSPTMDMGPTCSPAGTSLALTADGHKFDKDCLAVPAGESFTIRFDNKDSDRHNVAILPSHTATTTLFEGDIVQGPKSLTYNVPALKPGTYHFHCEVHPNLMNGAFIVGTAAPAAPAPSPAPAPKAGPTPAPTMSMGDAPAAVPAPKTADGAPAVAAPAPAAAAAPKPEAAARPASSAPSPKAAAAVGGSTLPHTGPHSARLLLILGGGALAAGGLSVLGGARRAGSRV
jgi:LPXTG-motif cell wall-anchored protein